MILVQRTYQQFSLLGTPDIGSTPISAAKKEAFGKKQEKLLG